MSEMLRVTAAVVVVISLGAIVAYLLVAASVAASTAARRRHDPLAEELDRVLFDIVGPRAGEARDAVSQGRRHGRLRVGGLHALASVLLAGAGSVLRHSGGRGSGAA